MVDYVKPNLTFLTSKVPSKLMELSMNGGAEFGLALIQCHNCTPFLPSSCCLLIAEQLSARWLIH